MKTLLHTVLRDAAFAFRNLLSCSPFSACGTGVTVVLAAVLTIFPGATGSAAEETTEHVRHSSGEGREWKLVWHDEFDYEGLPDPEKWGYEEGFIRNNEKQYYTRERKENARVERGRLIIEARKENYRDAEYTSASLITRDTASWRYGRVEVKAKLPTGRGMWPAIWMLGTNIREVGWPACGEIDIMEYVGFDPERVHGYVHTQAFNHRTGTQKGDSILLPSAGTEFHVYAIEWFEDRIDFFVDDHNYFTFENTGNGTAEWPFDQPHYLILNAAIGGSWGGQQGIDDSIFPQLYSIEYVRVYESVE